MTSKKLAATFLVVLERLLLAVLACSSRTLRPATVCRDDSDESWQRVDPDPTEEDSEGRGNANIEFKLRGLSRVLEMSETEPRFQSLFWKGQVSRLQSLDITVDLVRHHRGH
jgi:hypothetical protein